MICYLGTSGVLVPLTEARIMDIHTGEFIDPTLEGELLVRGPQVMQGYYKNAEATQATIRPDGFMVCASCSSFPISSAVSHDSI
jgi:long-subunit acyl-CoA synthetase (AMP-forming)